MKIKGLRWWVVTLIAIATIINYIDRQSLGVLWPEIANDLYPDFSDDERKRVGNERLSRDVQASNH